MERMDVLRRETEILLLNKIADILSGKISIEQIHSFVVTLSQLTENFEARNLYYKISIIGLSDLEEVAESLIHYFRFPSSCNVFSKEVLDKIEDLMKHINRSDLLYYRDNGLGTLIKAYGLVLSSKSNFNDLEVQMIKSALVNILNSIKRKIETCSDNQNSSFFIDLINLSISIIQS